MRDEQDDTAIDRVVETVSTYLNEVTADVRQVYYQHYPLGLFVSVQTTEGESSGAFISRAGRSLYCPWRRIGRLPRSRRACRAKMPCCGSSLRRSRRLTTRSWIGFGTVLVD